jgi:hypothetical protein
MHRHQAHRHGPHQAGTLALAEGLGWFSIGLGALELFAAPALARTFGMEGRENLLRAYGVREIATGVGILTQEDPTPWMWGRVAGDALDLATMAPGLTGRDGRAGNVALAMAAVAGVTALDVICARALSAEREQAQEPLPDYRDRVGMAHGPAAMRGAARDFQVPRDFRTPEPLRPYQA